MSVKLSDGTIIDTTDIHRLLSIVSDRASGKNPVQLTVELEKKIEVVPINVEEIKSKDGVTIKVGNLKIKKKKSQADHENFIEVKHRNCAIRVWRCDRESFFGCNCIDLSNSENIRYMEFSYGDYRDENRVFKCIQDWIDNGGMKNG